MAFTYNNMPTMPVYNMVVACALLLALSPTTRASPVLSVKLVDVQSDSLPQSVTESDCLAGQVSTQGGELLNTGSSQFLLTLNGVGQEAMAVEDPADPSTSRPISHAAVTNTLPRFAVFLTNTSETASAGMKFMSMNLLELTDSSDDSITYKVDLLNHDINNATGTAGLLAMSELSQHFRAGMLMIDLTPEQESGTDEPNTRSLKHLVDSNGLAVGPTPGAFGANSTEVRAQGLFTTAFLGPFNAWAWACCAFKQVEHWTIAWAFPMSWVTLFLCCV